MVRSTDSRVRLPTLPLRSWVVALEKSVKFSVLPFPHKDNYSTKWFLWGQHEWVHVKYSEHSLPGTQQSVLAIIISRNSLFWGPSITARAFMLLKRVKYLCSLALSLICNNKCTISTGQMIRKMCGGGEGWVELEKGIEGIKGDRKKLN